MTETPDEETGELPLISERAVVASQVWVQPPFNAELFAALHAAVSKLPEWITTDTPNEAFKKGGKALKYASLKTILEKVRPVLLENGVRIRQGADRSWPSDEGGGMKGRLIPVFTDLIHTATGQTERTMIEIPLSKLDPQGMGSAITYGRRYTLLAGLALATDEADDDGESGTLKDINDGHKDSPDLAAMTRELMAIKDGTKLIDWSSDARQKKRFSALEPDEQALMKQRYADRGKQIVSGNDDPVMKKKPVKE